MADVSSKNVKKLTKIGAYNVGKTIGKGNFAVVKLAEHCTAKEKVAIKLIDKSALSEDNLRKTMREVRLMKLINHTNIIRLYEVMETERYLYLVLEYAEKGEIFDLLIKNGRLHEKEARKMFRQIIAAVECLHQKRIVHRDLKAENLLLDENSRIKLADFGFSNMFAVGAKLKTFCGSPPYAAPELFDSKEYYGPAADIWSMGVVLYVLVCGALPFDGTTLSDLKQRVLTGKFRIPFFMSSDCESLIRHMLVVDLNKRYTMNQIKQHKWIIQGEPYEFIEEEDEFCFAQHHCNGSENGNNIYNKKILDQLEKMGEDKLQVIESIQKKKFDNLYGLYHILLDKHLKQLRLLSLQNKHYTESPSLHDNAQNKTTFNSVEPQSENILVEEGDPDPAELAKYFASKRRETIAVSHVTPDVHSTGFFNYVDAVDRVPDIAICQSPSPPPLHETPQLQYKEQYLPRPAVLQVRSQFDRRASDGSASLQESILQFNILRNNKSKSCKHGSNPYTVIDNDNSNNLLHIPVDADNTGSESDEAEKEAIEKYLSGRGKRQRHTITVGSVNRSNLAPTLEEYEENIGSLKEFHQQMAKLRTTNKIPNRERERASPIPYLPISPETRRLGTERRQSDGVFIDKDESSDSFKSLQAEHKRLQDQFCSSSIDSQSRQTSNSRRNLSSHSRDNFKRNSYPNYAENNSVPAECPVRDQELPATDPSLVLLQQKQEAQRKNMYVQFLVQRKFLEKQMEEERKELIRRASEGTPALESSISEFLAKKAVSSKQCSKDLPPNELQAVVNVGQSTELQDEMKKLNLQVSSGLPTTAINNEPLHFPETLFTENIKGPSNNNDNLPLFSIPDLHHTNIMDIDDQPILGDIHSSFQYANVQTLFSSPNNINNNNRSRRTHLLHNMSPTAIRGGTTSQSTFDSNQGIIGDRIWGAEVPPSPNSTVHRPLSNTFSVDLTTSLEMNEVVKRVQTYLNSRPDLDYNQSDSCFSLYKDNGIQMEIEVYQLSKSGDVNGVKLHRIGGDIWAYKKLRDEIYSGLYLD